MKYFGYFLTFGLGTILIVIPIYAHITGQFNLFEVEQSYRGDTAGIVMPIIGLAFIFGGYNLWKSLK